MTVIDDTTVRASTEVEARSRAFYVFTAEIETWWDDDKHILEARLAELCSSRSPAAASSSAAATAFPIT
jgi:hypothetical protein